MSAPSLGSSARIGLVGLGVMGVPIALRLREKGYAVTAWNREPERYEHVGEAGVAWAETPAEVWAASDAALVCVLGEDAVESVALGATGFAAAGSGARLLIDLSTTSPGATRSLAARFAEAKGAAWIDAPMSGGPAAAREGALTLMIGGAEDDCAAADPLLRAIAANVTRMGPVGAGQVAKILNQAIVGVGFTLMAELLDLAERAGVEPALLPGALAGGMADSVILQRILPQMAARDFEPPRGYARQLDKDLQAVAAFADKLGARAPVTSAAIARYHAFAEAGFKNRDSAAIALFHQNRGPDGEEIL